MTNKWYKHPEKPNRWISKEEYFNIMFGEEFMKSNDKGTLKQYECIEDGERFIVEASDWEDARQQAMVWNAQVIREIE